MRDTSRSYTDIALQTGMRLNTVLWWAYELHLSHLRRTRPYRRLTDQEVRLLMDLREQGVPNRIIATHLGVSVRTVVGLVARYGIERRGTPRG